MNKKQALEIFAQIANQTRATPQEHAAIKQAFDYLAELPEASDTGKDGP